MGRLQNYLGLRLEHPDAVWVLGGSDFPKQGRKSAGVARQYCGRLGKVANCQAGMFLAHISPLGRALVDKRLYLPESWSKDPERCRAAGVPEEEREYRSKTELALEMLELALARGHLKTGWVAGDAALGVLPSFRETLAALGMRYVLDVPAGFTAWPAEPERTRPEYQGWGAPRKPWLRAGQCRTMEQRAAAIPEGAWQEITVAQARVRAVTCSALQDADGVAETVTVSHPASGGGYAAVTAGDVTVTVTDDETPTAPGMVENLRFNTSAERDLRSIQMEEDRAIRLFVSGKITEAQLDLQRRFITERLESARARLDDYRAREAGGAEKRRLMETVLTWARELGQGLDELTPEQRKEILQMVVEQVVIDRDNNVDITLAIPIDDNYPEPDSNEPDSPETDSVAVASKEPS